MINMNKLKSKKKRKYDNLIDFWILDAVKKSY